MSLRRLLPILALALMLAPFGRMGLAEARATPDQVALQTAGHCAEQPLPSGAPDHERMGIDCMIACAAMHMAAQSFVAPLQIAPRTPEPAVQVHLSSIRPEAEPPPPRRS